MAHDDTTMQLAVVLTPATHALMRLVTVIRGRSATIVELRWRISECGTGVAFLQIVCAPRRQEHLLAVIAGIVDVRQVTRLGAACGDQAVAV